MNLLDRIAYDSGGYTVQEILSSFCNKILEIIDLVNKNEEVCDETHTIIENIRNEVIPDAVNDIMKEMQDNGYFDNLVNVTLIEQLRAEITTLLNQTISDFTSRLDNMANELTIKNVTNYGVVANSDVPQNVKINELLSTYTNTHFYFPKGRYVIDDSLIVFENTTIELHKDAVIEFKANTITASNKINPNLHTGKHIFKNDLNRGLKNIEIFGGKIIGNGKTQAQDAQRCFRFENVKNLKIHDMTVEEVSGWIFCYVNIDGFHFYNLRFKQASAEKYGYNGDGISGVGKNGVIENIYGYVSDDLVSIHTGETSIAKNLDSENILIRNIYAEPLIYEEDGVNVTEYCFRPFAFYNFNNRTSKNITVDGIYGISKTPLRIVCDGWENNNMLQNCEIKNIYVEVKPFTSSNLYDKCAFTIRNLRCSSIKFNNINVTYDGVEQMYGMFIDNSKIDNLFIENSGFENLNGNSPVILDKSSIANLYLDNLKMINTKGTGLAYYKAYLNTNTTRVIANNVYGNIDNIIGRDANSSVQVSRRYSTKTKTVGVEEIGTISLSSSQNIYEQYKIINVLGNSVQINLQPSTEENGYYFLLNVGDYTDTKLYSGTGRIFGTTVITKGLYVVARNHGKWNITKLSTTPLAENI